MTARVFSPEFQRHLWLRFSLFRLAAVPLALGIIVAATAAVTEAWQGQLFPPALAGCFIVIFLWGNFEAAACLNEETGGKTWDFQRMSSIGPWQLAIGKLAGATSYTWYVAAWLLALVVFSWGYADDPLTRGVPGAALGPLAGLLIAVILSGVMGQAASFMASLQSFRYRRAGNVGAFVIGLAVSGLSYRLLDPRHFAGLSGDWAGNVMWHGLPVDGQVFIIFSLLFFFFWIVAAIQRAMRQELQFRNAPGVWLVFVATLVAYVTGLAAPGWDLVSSRVAGQTVFVMKLTVAYYVAAGLGYLIMCAEAPGMARYGQWRRAVKGRQWRRAFETTPAWAATLAVLVLPLYVMLNLAMRDYPPSLRSFGFALSTGVLLFAVRDGAVIHALMTGGRWRHRSFGLAFYCLMAYALLPGLYVALFLKAGLLPGMYKAIGIPFYPGTGGTVAAAVLPALAQALAALYVMVRVLRRRRAV